LFLLINSYCAYTEKVTVSHEVLGIQNHITSCKCRLQPVIWYFQAKTDYKYRKEKDERARLQGDSKWILPSVEARIKAETKKEKKKKQKKKKKKA